jgi:hypothetical protein
MMMMRKRRIEMRVRMRIWRNDSEFVKFELNENV